MILNTIYGATPFHINGSFYFHGNLYGCSVQNSAAIAESSNAVFNDNINRSSSSNIVFNNNTTPDNSSSMVFNNNLKR